MASLEDYDEFGNYIGVDLESDDEDEVPQDDYARPAQPEAAPLEGYDDESIPKQDGDALMEIDGMLHCSIMAQSGYHFSRKQSHFIKL
jgi:U5 small nuclear ribonucleoprotein component